MRHLRRSISSFLAALALLPASVPAQESPVRFYAHGGVGLGRFVFLCSTCGDEQTSLVPSASVGVTLTRTDLDLGLYAIGWSHIGDRYTILTVGTTWRPDGMPLFIGGGVGMTIRQYPGVCSSCRGGNGTPVLSKGAEYHTAAMLQVGGRIPVGYRVGLEPYLQLSRLGAGPLTDGHANHLAVGLRIDGRSGGSRE